MYVDFLEQLRVLATIAEIARGALSRILSGGSQEHLDGAASQQAWLAWSRLLGEMLPVHLEAALA